MAQGGGYSGAASASESHTLGAQLGGDSHSVVNSTGFVLPQWAVPILIVVGFAVVIVWLLTRKN